MSEHQVPLPQLGLLLATIMVLGYLRCLRRTRAPWPRRRTAAWILGVTIAYLSALALLTMLPAPTTPPEPVGGPTPPEPVEGPTPPELVEGSPVEGLLGLLAGPTLHMLGHLGLAMVAPVLLVLGAPLTLVLRSLRVDRARRLVRFLHRAPVRWLVHPVVAAGLDVGGLWVLYTTPLLARTHTSAPLSALVIGHLVVAGFLFTAAMISIDPLPRRPSYAYRAVVLVLAAAAHGVLAKHLYAGASNDADRRAAMIMYYGGDVVEVGLVILLGLGWWRRAGDRVRPARPAGAAPSPATAQRHPAPR